MKTYEEMTKEIDALMDKWFDEKVSLSTIVAVFSAACELAKYDLAAALNRYHSKMNKKDKAEKV